MTSNQIAYWNLQENKRANLVNEGIKSAELEERKRSNLVNEELSSRKVTQGDWATAGKFFSDVLGASAKIAPLFI